MPTPRLSNEKCLEGLRLVREHGSTTYASKATGIDRRTIDHWVRKATERGLDGSVPKPSPPGRSIHGVSTLYDATGQVRAQWVKEKAEPSAEDIAEAMRAAFDEYKGRAEITPPPAESLSELLSVYPIADVHHGLLSWKPETGENYDIKIGSDRLMTCMGTLIAQSPLSEHAVLLNLGDFFHNNDGTNATPASKHSLDVDGRFFKVVTTGVRLFIRVIHAALPKHQTVTVVCLPGNHDQDSYIALIVGLGAFFHDEPRVEIVESPSEFWFHLFGKTLIGACHGHKLKPDRMAMAMATMRPAEWGRAKYRWMLFGHIHHETMKEVGDVRCESFQTLAGRDAYSAGHGFTSGRSVSSITLHAERGEIGRHRVNL